MPTFDDFPFAQSLFEGIELAGYVTPTPVQIQAIPAVLAGRDVLAAAQTGTGKTASFALPIMQKLLKDRKPRISNSVRVLVLASTRELAAQIDESFKLLGQKTDLKTALIFGGVNIRPQTMLLKQGVDILVATPGRLLDHISQGNLTLERVEMLVLDEADRMLDMGFIHDIKKIMKLMPSNRQTMLFSATFNPEIRELATSLLNHPTEIEIEKNKEATLITQEIYAIDKKRKRELLRDLIVDNQWSQVLVFTRMKYAANRLAAQLEKDGIQAAAIHGNKSQNARTKALSSFKAKELQVLVATDIAARGLDIEQLPHVVNFELPDVPEDYVHRIGRTGRAGQPGHAVSFFSEDDRQQLRQIERLLNKKFDMITPTGYNGPQPEDIEADDKKYDENRSKELKKMRESRRKDDKTRGSQSRFLRRSRGKPTQHDAPLEVHTSPTEISSTSEKTPKNLTSALEPSVILSTNNTAESCPEVLTKTNDKTPRTQRRGKFVRQRFVKKNTPIKEQTPASVVTTKSSNTETVQKETLAKSDSFDTKEKREKRQTPPKAFKKTDKNNQRSRSFNREPREWDDDNFGNSIHYKPKKTSSRPLRNNDPFHWEPSDPSQDRYQALSLPQRMPGDSYSPLERRKPTRQTNNRRNDSTIRSTVVKKTSSTRSPYGNFGKKHR